MNLDDIPGLAEARAWEASVRARAFLDVPRSIRGVEVVPLTLYRLGILAEGRNAFLCGGSLSAQAAAVFLWVVSPNFRVHDADGRALFIARLRDAGALTDLRACASDIGEFLEEMFLDSPAACAGGKGSTPTTSVEAVYVELFAEACGWDAATTMHTALPKLYQVLRRVTLRKDPDAKFINRRSDKVRGEWQRARRAAEAAAPPTEPST